MHRERENTRHKTCDIAKSITIKKVYLKFVSRFVCKKAKEDALLINQ